MLDLVGNPEDRKQAQVICHMVISAFRTYNRQYHSSVQWLSRHEKTNNMHMAENKDAQFVLRPGPKPRSWSAPLFSLLGCTIPTLPKYKISSLYAISMWLHSLVCIRPGQKPHCWFSSCCGSNGIMLRPRPNITRKLWNNIPRGGRWFYCRFTYKLILLSAPLQML